MAARTFGARPSQLLDAQDAYTAYCLDEAGAYLLAQPKPPNYRRADMKPANRDKRQLMMLKQLGANVKLETD
jgi:hypothetical protein